MDDWLRSMRAAAQAEQAELEDDDGGTDRQVDYVLAGFFASVPESEGFEIAIDVLAEDTSWSNAPAGAAAASARKVAAGPSPSDVVTALGVPGRQARGAVERALDLSRDAADLLLDRPAAVLLTFDPSRVRRLADLCQRAPGELFALIASSSRSSGGYVYAYRPGTTSDAAARRAAEPSGAGSLVEWGYAFFGLRPTAT
jgi:hypothetical protein